MLCDLGYNPVTSHVHGITCPWHHMSTLMLCSFVSQFILLMALSHHNVVSQYFSSWSIKFVISSKALPIYHSSPVKRLLKEGMNRSSSDGVLFTGFPSFLPVSQEQNCLRLPAILHASSSLFFGRLTKSLSTCTMAPLI